MLNERKIDFAYGYRMTCGVCQTNNWLTAEEHHAARLQEMVPCSMGHDFKFGNTAIALRDPHDVALNEGLVPQLVWYHTTTVPNWPARSRPLTADDVRQFELADLSDEQIHREKNKALHLGTYEAALESMLRNMHERGDQHSTFYLHRVRLREDVVIEKRLRNENHEPAANITTMDLALLGVNGVRYLNAYESMGGISLAIARGAIESTQGVALPVPELVGNPSEATVERIRSFRKKAQEIRDAHNGPANGSKVIAQRLALLKGDPPPIGPLDSTAAAEPMAAYRVLAEMNNFVGDQYLDGLSPVVRDTFLRSLHRPLPSEDHAADLAWLSKFMALAALFTHPGDVLRALDDQPWKDVNPACEALGEALS